MPVEERRATPRVALRLPLKLRPLDFGDASELDGESINLSEGGLLFVLDRPLEVGTAFTLAMTMPGELTGGVPMRVACTARVLRADPQHPTLGRAVNAARIERYETIVAEA
jgi:hypothetical protein